MKEDISAVISLRKVMEASAEGEGIARALVEEFRGSKPPGVGVARMLLLGLPLRSALDSYRERSSEEAGMLASLLTVAESSSATLVGRNGAFLGRTLETWIKLKENARMEQKVHRLRSVITSGVLGAVTAMVSSLGPLVGSLSFTSGVPAPDPQILTLAAAVMAGIASMMLGLYMSGRGFFVNVAVTLSVFAVVTAVAGPLVNVPTVALWGVK